MNKRIKVGIDIHGVIDVDPEFFSAFTYMLKAAGHKVHIVTGRELCDEIVDKLRNYKITYNHIFSITTHHKIINTPISYKNNDLTQPLINPVKWDKTKADYAASVGLDIHIDDSIVYGKYFNRLPDRKNTQYIVYTPAMKTFLWTLLKWSDNSEVLIDDGP